METTQVSGSSRVEEQNTELPYKRTLFSHNEEFTDMCYNLTLSERSQTQRPRTGLSREKSNRCQYNQNGYMSGYFGTALVHCDWLIWNAQHRQIYRDRNRMLFGGDRNFFWRGIMKCSEIRWWWWLYNLANMLKTTALYTLKRWFFMICKLYL